MSEWIVEIVDGIPHTRTMTELVRCKDCRYYEIYELKSDGTDDRRYKPSVCCLNSYAERREPDWYCADGEQVTP